MSVTRFHDVGAAGPPLMFPHQGLGPSSFPSAAWSQQSISPKAPQLGACLRHGDVPPRVLLGQAWDCAFLGQSVPFTDGSTWKPECSSGLELPQSPPTGLAKACGGVWSVL